jgi:gliding motility-associated-like protein
LCDSVKVSPKVTTTYTVIGTDSLGCQTEQVVTILVETACFNFTVPNVFTPTEAGILGLNNIFYIKTENMNSWSMQIYDRWGVEVFKSSDPTQYWNGNTEGGGQAPAGVYYYLIKGTCENNTYQKDGFVQLIR